MMTDHFTQLRLDAATQPRDMLAPDPLIVRLNKVFSWQQSASRWPYYLSRAEQGREYTKREIVEQVFSDDLSHHRAPDRGWLQSLYGVHVDREHAEVVIDGAGLFESVDSTRSKFVLTEDGAALAHAYSSDRISNNWRRVFAGILARNDVRVRCVLLRLARDRDLLVFRDGTTHDTFFLPGKGGALRAPDGRECPLFEYAKGQFPAYSFTPILEEQAYETLGPFLREKIERKGVRVPERVTFEGGREAIKANKEPSGNDLRLYMKQALSLFRDIEALVFVPHRQGWMLDRERCAALFEPELVADLFRGAPVARFLEALRGAYDKFSDAEGLVRVADIRDYVCDELDIPPGERIDYFNQQVAYYLRPDVGKLGIGRTFHAQAGPSDCLFGDLAQEYVEFIFARE